jgi:hypothetical protein
MNHLAAGRTRPTLRIVGRRPIDEVEVDVSSKNHPGEGNDSPSATLEVVVCLDHTRRRHVYFRKLAAISFWEREQKLLPVIKYLFSTCF